MEQRPAIKAWEKPSILILTRLSQGIARGKCNILNLGYPDEFIKHGSPADIEAKYGLDVDSITGKIIEFVGNENEE